MILLNNILCLFTDNTTGEPSDTEDLSELEIDFSEYDSSENDVLTPKTKRARKHLITDKLVTVLDRCKISERDSTHLLHTFLEAVNLDPSEYVINRTSLREKRQEIRQTIAGNSREIFPKNLDFVVIHWDGKMLKNFTGKTVERLAIIATTVTEEKLLGVPELPEATGSEICSAVYDTIENWGLSEKAQAFVFDTTASNTGRTELATY